MAKLLLFLRGNWPLGLRRSLAGEGHFALGSVQRERVTAQMLRLPECDGKCSSFEDTF